MVKLQLVEDSRPCRVGEFILFGLAWSSFNIQPNNKNIFRNFNSEKYIFSKFRIPQSTPSLAVTQR